MSKQHVSHTAPGLCANAPSPMGTRLSGRPEVR
jgi:hypothetical protein